MDTSKEYILMCEKAIEIQKIWHSKFINYGDETNKGTVQELEEYYSDDDTWNLKADGNYFDSRNLIWLPHQDQLQEIISESWSNINKNNEDILDVWYNFVKKQLPIYSFEKLWLMFAMKEKYNKIWDKKKQEWKSLTIN